MKALFDREIYERFTATALAKARKYVWIATANIKGTVIRHQGRYIQFVDFMAGQVNRGIGFRIIHAELPSAPFRERYEERDVGGELSAGVEFLHCIRMHAKVFIIDGNTALVGSANLTGAGVGAKARTRRNFEIGFLLEGERETRSFVRYFDYVWMGGQCVGCGRRDLCPAPAG
jgi:phosphatidylserine/phosphatidylglycerophosphate/cardiolipin synthase-like enzyme